MENRVAIPQERYSWVIQRVGLTVDDYRRQQHCVVLEEWINFVSPNHGKRKISKGCMSITFFNCPNIEDATEENR